MVLVSTAVLVFLFVRQATGQPKRVWDSLVLMVVGAGLAAAAWKLDSLGAWKTPVIGFASGLAVAAALLDFTDSEHPTWAGAPLGLAAIAFAVLPGLGVTDPLLYLGGAAGAAAAGAVTTLSGRSSASMAFVVCLLIAYAVGKLAPEGTPSDTQFAVLTVFGSALLSTILGEGLGALTKNGRFPWPKPGTGLLMTLMLVILTSKQQSMPELAMIVPGASLVAVVLAVALGSKDDSDPLKAVFGAMVWLAVGAAAFSFGKSYGLALAGLSGVCATLISGNRRAIAMMAPLFGLLMVRLGRNLFPDMSQAFDIGQHYALIGFLAGVLLPVGLLSAGAKCRQAGQVLGRGAVLGYGLAALGSIALAVAFLGSKGANGMLVGLSVGPVVGVVLTHSPAAAGTGLGLGGWCLAAIGSLSSSEDLTRGDKARLLAVYGLAILVVAVVASILGRPKKEEA